MLLINLKKSTFAPRLNECIHNYNGFILGNVKEGCELISQALGLFTNVYGALHQDVCVCLRLLGRIYYILGDYGEVRILCLLPFQLQLQT